MRTIIEKKRPHPCTHLNMGALWLPTKARHQQIYLSDSELCKIGNRNAPMSRWLQWGGDIFSVSDSTSLGLNMSWKPKQKTVK